MNVVVIDIGGTAIKYANMNDDMKMLSKGKVPTPQGNRDELINAITKIYNEYPESEGIAKFLCPASLIRRMATA